VMTARMSDVAPVPHAALLGGGTGGSIGSEASAGAVARYSNWTPSEIYLDLRTAPVGSMNRLGALVETLSVINRAIVISWTAGQAIGTVANYLLENYAPDLYTTIGGTVSEIYNEYLNATTLVTQGNYIGGLCTIVGVPAVQNSPMSRSDGDYGSTTSYTDYSSSGSACARGQKCAPPMAD
jgi:hypothetical protein